MNRSLETVQGEGAVWGFETRERGFSMAAVAAEGGEENGEEEASTVKITQSIITYPHVNKVPLT